MEIYPHPNIKLISKALSNLTSKCNSILDFLNLAYDFRYENVSIAPLQKKNEILTLLEILSQNKPKKLLEIGTSNGGTLFLLCKIASEDADIISIDLPEGPFGGKMYPDWKVSFYRTFASINQKIHLLRSDSHEEQTKTQCSKILNNKLLDFLLIDGDHSYDGVKKDFEMYGPLVRDGGIIAFHDVSNGPIENVGGVGKFWKEIKKKYNGIEIIDNTNDEGYGIGLILISKEKNGSNFQQILNIVNKNQNKRIIELQNNLRDLKLDFVQHPITAVLALYSDRPDLQQAFPEVYQGQLHNLIHWASEVNSGRNKEEIISKKILSKFSTWYSEFLTNKIKENEETQNLLAQLNNQIGSLNQEKNNLYTTNALLHQEKQNLSNANELLHQEKQNLSNANELLHQEKQNLSNANELLHKENTDLLKTNDFLRHEKIYLLKANEHLHQEQINLLKDKNNFEEKLYQLDEKIMIDTSHINLLTFENSRFQKELELIKSSFSFKLIRVLGSNIDKIFKKKKILNDIKATASASKKTIENEGIKSFVNHATDKIRKGEILLQSPFYKTIPIKSPTTKSIIVFDDLEEKKNFIPKFAASVVIPTRSDVSQLKALMENINSQLGFKNLKIIIVNSGNNSLDSLADFSNITILSIKPQEFSHSKVRNLGIKESQGDFIFFISDDVLLTSNHIFYDMCNVFSNDEKIAATSARQIPRSDSDLMAIYSLHEYYQSLDLTNDRVVFTDNFDNLSPIQRRRTAQIDDVCSCYKLDIISKYKFDKVNYAEDLDLGVRLIKDGFKISQLLSIGVIHSHKRPASYYLKRHYVEAKILSNLLNYQTFDYKKHGILSIQDMADQIFSLYNSLNLSIESLQNKNTFGISQIFNQLKKELSKNYSIKVETENSNPSLDLIFGQFCQPKNLPKDNFLLEDYFSSLNRFEIFLKNLYLNISSLDEDFYDTLYKLFAVIVGDRLGGFSLQIQNQITEKDFEKINGLLESGV